VPGRARRETGEGERGDHILPRTQEKVEPGGGSSALQGKGLPSRVSATGFRRESPPIEGYA